MYFAAFDDVVSSNLGYVICGNKPLRMLLHLITVIARYPYSALHLTRASGYGRLWNCLNVYKRFT
jgi:hypothetical protein